MNSKQKMVITACGVLFAGSIIFAPHHANGTGDMVFRPIGTKSQIPFSSNSSERRKIEDELKSAEQFAPEVWKGMSLDQFSHSMNDYSKGKDSTIDYTTGFYGWPVPNYTMLGGFWAILFVFGAIAWVCTKENTEPKARLGNPH